MTLLVSPAASGQGVLRSRALPGWPITMLIWGFPVWWVTGLLPFVPLIAGAVLAAFLLLRLKDIQLPPASLPLLAFVGWIVPCAVMIDSPSRYIGFGMRAATLISVAIIYIYIANARATIGVNDLLYGVCAIWGLIVIGGLLGWAFPDTRLTTPVGLLLPGGITSNELVRDLVFPPLAEVQEPWGAEEPFNRPSAPFPYANGWGSGYALATPVVITSFVMIRKTWVRVLVVLGLALSLVPVVASLNRGMFLMLGITAGYVALRLAVRGHFKALGVVLGGAGLATSVLLAAGVVERIASRQEVSDTTTGRASIYEATLEAVAQSPVLGYGAPRPSEDIGINLGTQGSFWMYIFSYGLVGASLFVTFLLVAMIRTSWTVASVATACIHGVLVSALVGSLFYGYDFTQWLILVLGLSVLVRHQQGAEAPPESQSLVIQS